MASFRSWARWFLFRLHWRLLLSTAAYLAAPHVLPERRAEDMRSVCFAVIVASLGAWATHVANRNGSKPSKAGLFGARREDGR